MRYAIEKDGFTLNIILADDAAVAALIATQQEAKARPLAEGEQPPLPYPSVEPMPLPVPSCTPRQARLALAGAGLLTGRLCWPLPRRAGSATNSLMPSLPWPRACDT
jgi:hypothetical protein